jgi:hypothetical protein
MIWIKTKDKIINQDDQVELKIEKIKSKLNQRVFYKYNENLNI